MTNLEIKQKIDTNNNYLHKSNRMSGKGDPCGRLQFYVVQHSKLGIADAATYRDVYIKQEELKENLAFCAKSEYNKLIHYKHLRRI